MNVRQFFRQFATLSVIFLAVWYVGLYVDAVIDEREGRAALTNGIKRAQDDFARTLSGYAADLGVLSKGHHVLALASGDKAAKEDIAAEFGNFASQKPLIAQIRYLDRSGNEIVRVDRRRGAVVRVEDGELQNKADRYYFQQAISLPDGGLFVSAIDLNIERGKIEEPWRPMLRFATPVRPSGPATAGIVVLNIDVGALVDRLAQAGLGDAAPFQILNHDGYWLAGVPEDQRWGFMFGRDTTLAYTNPDVWQQVSAGVSGAFEEGGTNYVFTTLKPASQLAGTLEGASVRTFENDWIILATARGVSPFDVWRGFHPMVIGIGLIIIALICLKWSRSGRGHA